MWIKVKLWGFRLCIVGGRCTKWKGGCKNKGDGEGEDISSGGW